MKRAVFSVSMWTLCASATGFLREAACAWRFGASGGADAVALSFYYAESVYTWIFTATIGFSAIPIMGRLLTEGRTAETWQFSKALLRGACVLTAVIVPLAIWVVSGRVGRTLSQPGSSASDAVVVGTIIACGFLSVAATAAALLQGYRDLASPHIVRAAGNAVVVLGILMAGATLGPVAAVAALCVGALLQCGLLFGRLSARRVPATERFSRWPAILAAARGGLPAGLQFLIFAFLLGTVERIFLLSRGPGAVATINYGLRLMSSFAMVSLAVQTVSFSEMASHVTADAGASRGKAGVLASLGAGVRLGSILTIPMTALALLFREPIVILLFQRGALATDAALQTSSAFGIYALSLFPGLVVGLTSRALYVLGRPWRAVLSVSIMAVAVACFDWVALNRMGALAIPLGYSLGMSLIAVLQVKFLGEEGPRIFAAQVPYLLRVSAATIFASAIVLTVAVGVGPALATHPFRNIIGFAIGGVVFAIGLLSAGTVLGLGEVRALWRAVRQALRWS